MIHSHWTLVIATFDFDVLLKLKSSVHFLAFAPYMLFLCCIFLVLILLYMFASLKQSQASQSHPPPHLNPLFFFLWILQTHNYYCCKTVSLLQHTTTTNKIKPTFSRFPKIFNRAKKATYNFISAISTFKDFLPLSPVSLSLYKSLSTGKSRHLQREEKMREAWTAMASMMGVIAFCQTLLSTLLPPELRFAVMKAVSRLSNYFSSYCYFDITEIDGVNTNELYNAVQLYLSAAASSNASHRLSLTRALNSSTITFGLSSNDTVPDTFNGAAVQWEHTVTQRQSASFSWRPLPDERRGFTLRIRKHHKSLILNSYLDHIMHRAEEIRRKNEDRYLYTNSRGGTLDSRGPQPWEAVPFKHPSTFETLAMDPARKSEIMADLKEFAAGQSFYQKTGRAWKRGYLLYGPPGTGKSSMIAAMANHLGYDIYDLELTEVNSNSELRKLLMKTTSKSIIVIEDIDCSISLSNRKSKDRSGRMRNPDRSGFPIGSSSEEGSGGASGSSGNSVTLSGLLNFTDGLWSCCGSERIFVFTTNHIERLDPALLRSGRMDMHIHMGHCNFRSLAILLQNYLGVTPSDAAVVEEMKTVVEAAEITPADVSEVLLRHRKEKGKAMRELLEEMRRRSAERKSRSAGEKEAEEEEKRALEEEDDVAAGGGGCWEECGAQLEMFDQDEEEEKDNTNRDKKKNI